MVGRQVVYAPCKINLHLGIHAQTDSRGYHRVDSVMMPVGLFDEVVVDDAGGRCGRGAPRPPR